MNTNKTKGLPCYVYRNGPDCSLGGLSSKHDRILVVGIDGFETIKEAEASGTPVFQVDYSTNGYIKLLPLGAEKGRYGFGGNFAHSCDSRFSRVSRYPLPIHDRDMNKEG